MAKDGLSFEAAAEKRALKRTDTPLFVRTDYLEGMGEASVLTDAAAKLKQSEISAPVDTRRGPVIFRVAEVQKADEESFKKDKDEYSKRVLAIKKLDELEKWLRALEVKENNKVLIDFEDYEKYFR